MSRGPLTAIEVHLLKTIPSPSSSLLNLKSGRLDSSRWIIESDRFIARNVSCSQHPSSFMKNLLTSKTRPVASKKTEQRSSSLIICICRNRSPLMTLFRSSHNLTCKNSIKIQKNIPCATRQHGSPSPDNILVSPRSCEKSSIQSNYDKQLCIRQIVYE